jgi:hypothetical protein
MFVLFCFDFVLFVHWNFHLFFSFSFPLVKQFSVSFICAPVGLKVPLELVLYFKAQHAPRSPLHNVVNDSTLLSPEKEREKKSNSLLQFSFLKKKKNYEVT